VTAIIVMVVGFVAVVSAIVILVVVVKHVRRETDPPSDPMRILEVRVARGEITTDEYHEQRSRLHPPPSPGTHHRGTAR
jgi:uncharacterized membrane protein